MTGRKWVKKKIGQKNTLSNTENYFEKSPVFFYFSIKNLFELSSNYEED